MPRTSHLREPRAEMQKKEGRGRGKREVRARGRGRKEAAPQAAGTAWVPGHTNDRTTFVSATHPGRLLVHLRTPKSSWAVKLSVIKLATTSPLGL